MLEVSGCKGVLGRGQPVHQADLQAGHLSSFGCGLEEA